MLGQVNSMPDDIMHAEAGHYSISPLEFVSYSEDFYEAFISHTSDRPYSPAKYYLAARSLELSFKAFLRLKGISGEELKNNFGHNLNIILKKCKELGISDYIGLTNEDEVSVKYLNFWYFRKGLEYFEIESLTENHQDLPNLQDLGELLSKLISGLKNPCLKEVN